MKQDAGATRQQAEEAAKMMAATFVEVNSDKTLTAGMGGARAESNWTFNKRSS